MANKTNETLANIQSMIDIMSERLVALRDLRLQKFIKDEIRSLEGKLLRQFWEQLKIKSQNTDKVNRTYESYPSLSKWLVVVGVSDAARQKILGKLSMMEPWISLSENEISKFLDGLPNDKEDVRKVCEAHSHLRNFNAEKDTDNIYWDSWKKGPNENGYESNDNASNVDHNENVQIPPKSETTSPPSGAHLGNQHFHEEKLPRYNSREDTYTGSLKNMGLANNFDTSSLDRNQTLPHVSTDALANARIGKSHSRQNSGHLLQKPKTSISSSSIGPSQLTSSTEKISSAPRKIKKRPGSIELRDTALPDFADMMRPNSATVTRKTSQTTSTSYDSSCGSPMSPRTPLTPVTPHMFPLHVRDTTEHPASHHAKSSRFKGLRAIKDKIKDKMGISTKLRRNKSEERLDEAGNEKHYHKARSDTCPDTSALIAGFDKDDTAFGLLNSAHIASNLSRHNIETLPDNNFHSQLLISYRDSCEDLTNDANGQPTRSNSSDDGVVTADESGDNEEFNQTKYRGRLMRQSSAVNEEWDVPWDELVFQERIGQGRVGTVHKGKWHGEVAIRVIDLIHNDERKLRAFKEEVTLYKKTRHDNIELFMGSSMNLPKLAIITSYCRGKSLYQYIRSSRDHVSLNNAKIIAQHIAQGMGYLHSRGIVHKDLKSKNVFIDRNRVTITDFGILGLHSISSKTIPMKPATLQIPDGWLCYMAPEIIRALRVPDPKSYVPLSLPYTKESDMYAFGTVWYELLTSSWPFEGCCAESIIWQVGNGCKQSLSHFQGSKEVKDILMACWARDPSQRQDFSDSGVMGQLLRLPQTKIIRRSSQPIKTNKKGGKHPGMGTSDRMFDLSLHSVIHELAE